MQRKCFEVGLCTERDRQFIIVANCCWTSYECLQCFALCRDRRRHHFASVLLLPVLDISFSFSMISLIDEADQCPLCVSRAVVHGVVVLVLRARVWLLTSQLNKLY